MAIDPLPTPPSRQDAANFSDRADAFLGALPLFGAQANDQATASNAAAAQAVQAATTAVNAPGTSATSTTSLAIGTGAKALAIQTNKSLVPGMFVTIARTSDPNSWMVGQVTGYTASSGALQVTVTLTNGAGTYTDWTVSLGPPVFFAVATVAQLLAGASSAVAVTPAALIAAAAPVALVDAATITPDLATGINFTVTLGGNRILANPANAQPGASGVVIVSQDGTGSRALAYGSAWKFPGGAPVLSNTAAAIDVISYFVVSPTLILCTLVRAFR